MQVRGAFCLMPCLLLTLHDGDSYVHQLEERLYELVFDWMNLGAIYRTLRQIE
jgi:hypothetical protein